MTQAERYEKMRSDYGLPRQNMIVRHSQRIRKHGPGCKHKALRLILLLKLRADVPEVVLPVSHHELQTKNKYIAFKFKLNIHDAWSIEGIPGMCHLCAHILAWVW